MFAKMRDLWPLLIMFLISGAIGPLLNEHKPPSICLISKEVVPQVSLVLSRRLNNGSQVGPQPVFLPLLRIENRNDKEIGRDVSFFSERSDIELDDHQRECVGSPD